MIETDKDNFSNANYNKIFVLSGLGVDKRVFYKVNFGKYEVKFIDWIAPLKNESIASYALRISSQIDSEHPILVGLSFGGMITIEIAKIIEVKKVLLIASAKTRHEIPAIYRMMCILPLHNWIPTRLLKHSNPLTNWFFGTQSSSDKILLKQILADTDANFLRWALNAIVNWKNLKGQPYCVHIHGVNDRILPVRNIKVDHTVDDAGHFMTVTNAEEINILLKQILD